MDVHDVQHRWPPLPPKSVLVIYGRPFIWTVWSVEHQNWSREILSSQALPTKGKGLLKKGTMKGIFMADISDFFPTCFGTANIFRCRKALPRFSLFHLCCQPKFKRTKKNHSSAIYALGYTQYLPKSELHHVLRVAVTMQIRQEFGFEKMNTIKHAMIKLKFRVRERFTMSPSRRWGKRWGSYQLPDSTSC